MPKKNKRPIDERIVTIAEMLDGISDETKRMSESLIKEEDDEEEDEE